MSGKEDIAYRAVFVSETVGLKAARAVISLYSRTHKGSIHPAVLLISVTIPSSFGSGDSVILCSTSCDHE